MKRLWKGMVLLFLAMIFLAACSSNSESSKSSDSANYEATEKMTLNHSTEEGKIEETTEDKQATASSQSRMVIYNATLDMEVKKITQVQEQITQMVKQLGGYIVEQNMSQNTEERKDSSLTIRIPQEQFHSFLNKVKKLGVKTENQNISGQDVTEEYVDLTSRLKAKQLVEKRLTTFMNEAKDTKTLLEISNELAKVQEEIETIQGQMKYLENQTSLSTVTINLFEKTVVVPGFDNDKQNTWDQTKKQFMNSINYIAAFFSGLFILIIGNIPILAILALIGGISYIVWRRVKKKINHKDE
ncbi:MULTISPECIES: DUF4349 domain-containing protein [Heyndrickxia]|jgi:type III secretory pathway component EscV/nitrate reductase NapE component|uniref:DUF4349 domain-containing protein n=1 Tax=Heyndrickxia TaxID=2837504 RepID=UPI000717512E|nr:DUF4349 domain-containing protein [Heyndrickxia oleronia]NYV68200.1 DUF4349 domain-containing protein [Bacillus sp. Gen3]OJH17762.1 hypothetical protein BLX88_16775 [Bacillus obstructivus]MBU5213155.1 DUF4349 domain-containing protein [Heyndrickxia oleronia]MCI1590858.1 DUF4349 domain-containing protein [Heyndrickxia oleronia]MCI1613969.1 DUF4349 domain-containing protein [Heyndrickxia oleronia]